ncbi:gamma-glutamylcyclotransferase family protein [Vibrio aestuarianus]|uniref:gamma-glutamylcyclotransferase family protein n=1 Tax=Vibrio aestuarianus TaxID=28171 RepID=UPI00237CF438|nr:gamma-glutamylcyclotransferase [Vibrio aestuarianus]MDE1330545.1 gamma-glutamylcyclotransferase [Vibrio aestuarianus]
MQHLVFVYGTLRQGESNHHFLQSGQMLGSFITASEYALYDLGTYPGLIKGHQSITGEVYMIDEATLKQLDILEDVPVEYRREMIDTPFGRAWVYIYQQVGDLNSQIDSGDWCQRV